MQFGQHLLPALEQCRFLFFPGLDAGEQIAILGAVAQSSHGEGAVLPLQILQVGIPRQGLPLALDLGGQYL